MARETPEQYFRSRAAFYRAAGNEWVADFMTRLADNCAALAVELAAQGETYCPF